MLMLKNMSRFARKVQDEQIRKIMKDEQHKKINANAPVKGYGDAKIALTL